jgi:CRP-like cAMP-binding protein
MLAATHNARKQHFAPRETILQQGQAVKHFCMIESGQVEIIVNNNQSNEIRLASLCPGQFFGEVELTQGGDSIASVRAGKNGAEIALLPKDVFFKLIDDSPLTRSKIQEVAETRRAEHNRRRTDS